MPGITEISVTTFDLLIGIYLNCRLLLENVAFYYSMSHATSRDCGHLKNMSDIGFYTFCLEWV